MGTSSPYPLTAPLGLGRRAACSLGQNPSLGSSPSVLPYWSCGGEAGLPQAWDKNPVFFPLQCSPIGIPLPGLEARVIFDSGFGIWPNPRTAALWEMAEGSSLPSCSADVNPSCAELSFRDPVSGTPKTATYLLRR